MHFYTHLGFKCKCTLFSSSEINSLMTRSSKDDIAKGIDLLLHRTSAKTRVSIRKWEVGKAHFLLIDANKWSE